MRGSAAVNAIKPWHTGLCVCAICLTIVAAASKALEDYMLMCRLTG